LIVAYAIYDRATAPAQRQDHWEEVGRGRYYLQHRRPDLALKCVEMVRDQAPGSGEAMTVAGLALVQLRDYRSARLALERALKLRPDQVDATKALATLNLMLGNGVRGLELLRNATRLDPNDGKIWLVLGKVAHDLGDTAESSAAFEETLKRDPTNREARVGLVTDLLNSHRAEAATGVLTEALRDLPEDPALLGLAARHARDVGRNDEAVDLASKALNGDPDDLNALLVRARFRLAAGHADQALGDLERAVASHPSDTAALQLLVQAQTRLGMTDKAQETIARQRRASKRAVLMDQLARQIAERPDDPEPHWRMGQAAAEGGATMLAGRCFEAALALNPDCKPARDGLLALRGTRGEVSRAPDAFVPAGETSGMPGVPSHSTR
jgi:tetratricopeptide (TPR) repeat protein